MKTIIKGLQVKKNTNGFLAIRLYYTADPDKDPDTTKGIKWYKKTREGYSVSQWNREYEINFKTSSGKGIYTEDFVPKLSIKETEYDENEMLYRSWDFGYRHPAVLFAQIQKINNINRLVVLKEYQGDDITIYKFAPEVIKMTEAFYPKAKIRDFCDPAGIQKNDKSEETTIDILKREFHIRPRFKKINIFTGIEYVRKLMLCQADGLPLILINPQCKLLIDGITGGYIFKRNSDKPVDDGYFEHIQDCLRYLVINLLRKFNFKEGESNEDKMKKDKNDKTYYLKRYQQTHRRNLNPFTGY